MVRFIIRFLELSLGYEKGFTFHYGQIYYFVEFAPSIKIWVIYIPLWLDLLLMERKVRGLPRLNLHSTMVRFIMVNPCVFLDIFDEFTFHYGQIYYAREKRGVGMKETIYIPLWLDLLWYKIQGDFKCLVLFTFHYGQIYYEAD